MPTSWRKLLVISNQQITYKCWWVWTLTPLIYVTQNQDYKVPSESTYRCWEVVFFWKLSLGECCYQNKMDPRYCGSGTYLEKLDCLFPFPILNCSWFGKTLSGALKITQLHRLHTLETKSLKKVFWWMWVLDVLSRI